MVDLQGIPVGNRTINSNYNIKYNYILAMSEYLNVYNEYGGKFAGGTHNRKFHKASYMVYFPWRQENIYTKWVICRIIRSEVLFLIPA